MQQTKNSRRAAGVLVSLAADLIQHFAVIMDIPRKNLKLPGEGEISVANLECDPRLIGAFREEPGIFPGWHMNKAHWLSMALDGTVKDGLMRKRNKKMILRLNEKEYQDLQKNAKKSCLPRSTYCREKFLAAEVTPAPIVDYGALITEVKRVGRRIELVLQKSNTTGILDVPRLRKALEESHCLNETIWKYFQG